MLALSGKTAATTFFFLSFERIAFLAFKIFRDIVLVLGATQWNHFGSGFRTAVVKIIYSSILFFE